MARIAGIINAMACTMIYAKRIEMTFPAIILIIIGFLALNIVAVEEFGPDSIDDID